MTETKVSQQNGFRNRIIGYGTKAASQFAFNPRNARRHPQKQRDVVHASLRDMGWVAPVVENVRTGYLLDGHERIWNALQQGDETEVPYVQVDLDESEEPLFLVSFDYMTGLAEYDRELLDALLQDVQSSDAAVQAMLAELAAQEDIIPPDFEPVPEDEQPRLDQKKPVTCPECGCEFVPEG